MKNVAILGSTGSIGCQALEVIDEFKEILNVVALTCHSNINLLEQQINKYHPEMVAVMDAKQGILLQKKLGKKCPVVIGIKGLIEAASWDSAEMVLTAVSGMIGLQPTLAAIEKGKDIALANKETLVAGGELVMKAAAEKGIKILPVDSEHAAIFQCLYGNTHESIKKLIITASGGPFRGYTQEQMTAITVEQALKHPSWHMGAKITIDSATLMNKGLEMIEAHWLFDVGLDKIDVVVHPQSIIHSMVEFKDHVVMGQMGLPDMTLPIQMAFLYPNRLENTRESLDLAKIATLTFEKPDLDNFKCLNLAKEALKIGGTMPTALNGANEIAVARFLNKEIAFLDIAKINEEVMSQHTEKQAPFLEDILETDAWARKMATVFKA